MSKYTAEIEKIIARAEEDGYQRGWRAARDALNSPTPRIRVAGNVVAPADKKTFKVRKPPKSASSGQTVEQRVLDAIEQNPGKTGAEIIALLGDVNGRTVRTMLRRLRMNKHKIENRGGLWYKK